MTSLLESDCDECFVIRAPIIIVEYFVTFMNYLNNLFSLDKLNYANDSIMYI